MKVAVVGAGIVGAAIGFRLACDGHDITFFDPAPDAQSASYGNAGHIGTASVIPWASSENLSTAFGNHRDPNHPLVLRIGDMLKQPGWLIRFLRASRPEAARRNAMALASILSLSDKWLQAMLEDADASSLRQCQGLLHVYLSERTASSARPALARRRELGIAVTDLSAKDLFDLEPNLLASAARSRVAAATLFPNVGQILSPQELLIAFRKKSRANFKAEEVVKVRGTSSGVALQTPVQHYKFDAAVVAAGVASTGLLRSTGPCVPVIAERGYHEQYRMRASFQRSALFVDIRAVASPMKAGVRLTTGAEFTSIKRAPDHDRMHPVFNRARRLLGLQNACPEKWYGDRPSTPDSLPIIGPARSSRRIFLAFGHGHLGLTMSGITAEIVRAHFAGEPSPVDLQLFRPNR